MKKTFVILSIFLLIIPIGIWGVLKEHANWDKQTLLGNELLLKEAYKFYNVKTPNDVVKKASININKKPTANDYYFRGLAQGILENYNEELNDYNKAIKLNENDYRIYKDKGNALNSLGKYDEAIKNCNKAISLKKDYAGAYVCIALAIEYKTNNHLEAIKYFDKAILYNPKSAVIYNNRGNAKDGLGRYNEAIEDFDKAIKIDSNDWTYLSNRGLAYYHLANYNKALSDYNASIKLYQKNSIVYYNRGLCKEAMGDISGAVSDYKKALKLNPNNQSIKEKLIQLKK